MLVLGLETSCDETAAAIVTNVADPGARVVAETVLSQLDEHRPYGGVVPEIASRAHVEHLDRIIAETLKRAGLALASIDAIAATAGPGLIGGLLVGIMTAKALALAAGKPLIAVNHLEGHALTARLTDDVPFPYLLLLVSGGHCQFLAVEGVGSFVRIGTTIDDAAGEAFDKTAKLLGLGYPGGPAVERAAEFGNAQAFDLPRPMYGRPGCDFSFSGLKTAVRNARATLGPDPAPERISDLAASFQQAVMDIVADRARHAMTWFRDRHDRGEPIPFVVAGGVAANKALRARLQKEASRQGFRLIAPPIKYCTDNGAMIAWAGLERFRLGMIDTLSAPARARWPLDPDAEPKPFAGSKA